MAAKDISSRSAFASSSSSSSLTGSASGAFPPYRSGPSFFLHHRALCIRIPTGFIGPKPHLTQTSVFASPGTFPPIVRFPPGVEPLPDDLMLTCGGGFALAAAAVAGVASRRAV